MLTEVFIDGGSRGQGQQDVGEAACAVVIYRNKKHTDTYARPLGRRTNNEAEYEALIHALLMCSSSDISDPIIYSDSAVVVNQVTGKWECRNERLRVLLLAVRIIKEEYRFRIQQVPRADVHEADAKVNECLDRLEQERKLLSVKR